MDGVVWCSSRDLKCGDGLHGTGRRGLPARQHRHHERVSAEHSSGSFFCPADGAEYGSSGRRAGDDALQLCGVYLLFLPSLEKERRHLCLCPALYVSTGQAGGDGCVLGGYPGRHTESAERDGNDGAEQFYGVLWF